MAMRMQELCGQWHPMIVVVFVVIVDVDHWIFAAATESVCIIQIDHFQTAFGQGGWADYCRIGMDDVRWRQCHHCAAGRRNDNSFHRLVLLWWLRWWWRWRQRECCHTIVLVTVHRWATICITRACRQRRWSCNNNAVWRWWRCRHRWRQRWRFSLQIISSIFVIDQCPWVGRFASQQMAECTTKCTIFPCIDDGIHARIGHCQRKGRLVISRWTVCGKFENLRRCHHKVR